MTGWVRAAADVTLRLGWRRGRIAVAVRVRATPNFCNRGGVPECVEKCPERIEQVGRNGPKRRDEKHGEESSAHGNGISCAAPAAEPPLARGVRTPLILGAADPSVA